MASTTWLEVACLGVLAGCGGPSPRPAPPTPPTASPSARAPVVECAPHERLVLGRCRRERAMAMAAFHVCWLAEDRTVRCRESNEYGESGAGGCEAGHGCRVSGIGDVVALAVGGYPTTSGLSSCALRRDSSVWCWGVGVGPTPRRVPELDGAFEIAVASGRVCGLREPGTIHCVDVFETPSLPRWDAIGGITDATGVAVSETGAGIVGCAIRQGGGIACWGSSLAMQTMPASKPIDDIGRWGTLEVARRPRALAQITANDDGWAVLEASGRASSWRLNSPEPVRVARVEDLDDAIEIASGDSLGCALQTDGTVVWWAEPGDPVAPIPDLDDAIHVGVGLQEICAMRENRAIVCWTRGDDGVWSEPTVENAGS